MKIPTIQGIIDRRILINFRADTTVVSKFLPPPFQPRLFGGQAIVGICLIRLKNIRPSGFPEIIGISSENAAHRIAVEWNENGQKKQGVYIPRRDTNSLLNHWTGGHLFPGVHHLAKFNVKETESHYSIDINSEDHTFISISARQTEHFRTESVFKTLETASAFFKDGAIGFSLNKSGYDGLELKTHQWQVFPLAVEKVRSSFFENESVFPKNSVHFDNALLMRNLEHTWNSYEACPC